MIQISDCKMMKFISFSWGLSYQPLLVVSQIFEQFVNVLLVVVTKNDFIIFLVVINELHGGHCCNNTSVFVSTVATLSWY